jgi:hypothetical protein
MAEVVKHAAKKARQHTVYKLQNGERVPGVTTITGTMDKPQLVRWANQMGLKGIDTTKYVDELAEVGTLAHDGIHCHLTGQPWVTDDYSKNQIDLASNGIIKWHYWADQHKIEVLHSERVLVSEQHRYGGTPDLYTILDGKPVLLDIKSGKGIYDEHFTQTAGYYLLLKEQGLPVCSVYIVRIGRTDDEGTQPEVRECGDIDLHVERFLCCRKLYDLNQRIRKAG